MAKASKLTGYQLVNFELGAKIMNTYIRICRTPYEEPHLLNLVFEAANGAHCGKLEIYANASDLSEAARRLNGFPHHAQEVFLWELGSENPDDRSAFYFRFRVFQFKVTGLCAVQIRLNNNRALPDRAISEFCIEAYPADLNRLGKLFEQFSKLEQKVLDWRVIDGGLS